MNITIEPTPEMYAAPIDGKVIPVRIWTGHTDGGIPVEAYVLSITPNDVADVDRLRASLPFFMVPSRKLYAIDGHEKEATDA